MSASKWATWLLPLLAISFIAALVHLFRLRYESGDVYPPYSSLRADPLGAKAFYESLERLRGFEVRRNLQSLDKLSDNGRSTLFWLGLDIEALSQIEEDLVKQWEARVLRGDRLILSFSPENTKPWRPRSIGRRESSRPPEEEREIRDEAEPAPDGSNTDADREATSAKQRNVRRTKSPADELSRLVSLRARWRVGYGYEDLPKSDRDDYLPIEVQRSANESLPESISWRTALYFEPLDDTWRVLYERDGRPVLIERKLGSGTIVLSADSYFLSNQAMREDRYPELLVWLVGSNPAMVFDETHLGVAENPGVATLARKYRLHGVLVGLLLLAALFVWKNACSLVPRRMESSDLSGSELVGGRDSAAGFVNLLRRSIPVSEVLSVCFEQWKSAHAHDRGLSRDKLERMQAVLEQEKARPARERSPLACYRTLSRIFSERERAGRNKNLCE